MGQEIRQEIDQLRASIADNQKRLNQLLLKIEELEAMAESGRKAGSLGGQISVGS
jgi:mevalonate kinase